MGNHGLNLHYYLTDTFHMGSVDASTQVSAFLVNWFWEEYFFLKYQQMFNNSSPLKESTALRFNKIESP